MDQPGWASFTPDQLQTQVLGRPIQFIEAIGSTNDALKAAARQGVAEGLVCVTDEQTAGRGRRGRQWTAPAGSSLLVSALLRPTWLPASAAFYMTILTAVAAAEAIEGTTHLRIDLKWPNDLQIAGRKVGGILVESEIRDTQLHWVVLGCGINVNWDPRELPELRNIATSIRAELGQPIARRTLLQAYVQRLDTHYTQLRHGARMALFAAWRDRLVTLGQPVTVDIAGTTVIGVATDVTLDGALVVQDAHGDHHTVTAGDVTVRARS